MPCENMEYHTESSGPSALTCRRLYSLWAFKLWRGVHSERRADILIGPTGAILPC